MNKISFYNKDKASVCTNKNCITVYGETARIINAIAIFTAVLLAVVYITKALR